MIEKIGDFRRFKWMVRPDGDGWDAALLPRPSGFLDENGEGEEEEDYDNHQLLCDQFQQRDC